MNSIEVSGSGAFWRLAFGACSLEFRRFCISLSSWFNALVRRPVVSLC